MSRVPHPSEAEDREAAVREAFVRQAGWCADLGSPFTALLCATLARKLDGTSGVGRRVLGWTGRPDSLLDAVPLRLAGALNGIVRAGHAPALARLYPPHPLPMPEALWTALAATLRERETELVGWLDSAPQTNEVGRSAVLMAGLMVVSDRTRQPLHLFELGASAGLNLVLDRYAYRLGSVTTGAADAALTLAPAWEGPDPPAAVVRIAGRRGVDLSPLDVADAADRARLLAYVWPDRIERVARLEAALSIAAAAPPPIDREDAFAWLGRVLGREGEPGRTRVVLHSIAFQYFPVATAAGIAAHMDEVGAAANAESPLAWLRYESDPELGGRPCLRLRFWPGGEDRLLARAHPHGQHVCWNT